ncbi:hypothetical protein HPB52_023373 [Rhipicephalus sanguineus]|uniref:Uncharacterized protein n=1 Tax=Rhipicephalus sanguineus TaxID=34632 RepID=A0A9D4QEP4_RHISA|nr:hypothetical protein HPB52_023373 [Rhipicephalus sanguineus]
MRTARALHAPCSPQPVKGGQGGVSALNAELETFMTDEQVIEDYNSVMEFDDAATSALALLDHHVDRLKVCSPTSMAHPPATTHEDPPATLHREPRRPQLRPFWDTFSHAVHNNPNLSNWDRFHYLISLLDGVAAQAVTGIEVTHSSYRDALEILKQ